MNILCIENLSKSFGSHKVIQNLSFSVPENTIYGFLGQNGAGKTTTMKIILGLLKPDNGKISVCGETVRYGDTKTNRHIGFLPDVPEYYGYMKPVEYLDLCGKVAGQSSSYIKKKSEELLYLVGLEQAGKKIGSFSRGMKQRLGIAQALLNEPKLLICDEPTSALDPIGRKEILDILLSVRGKTTILFSTHILSDVERICGHAAVLHKGSLVLNGTLSELKQQGRQDSIYIEFARAEDMNTFCRLEALSFLKESMQVTGTGMTIHSDNIMEAWQKIYQAFADLKIYPLKAEVLEPSLENLFMKVVG